LSKGSSREPMTANGRASHPGGNRVNFPVVGIFEFDGDRLLCEKVFFDMAAVLTQMLPGTS
jgi:limonene-1,2-epoxide hydrolase